MFEFTQDCMINIESIDNEHRHLFELLNDAVAAVNKTDNVSETAAKMLKELKEYARTHFAHEEEYMMSINDLELPLQKKEHAFFTAKINSFSIDGMSEDEAKKALNELLAYLVRWLYKHILGSDMMIGKMTEDPFSFTDKYLTGISFIDEEHSHLFEIIKDTNDVIHNPYIPDKYDEIMRLISELKDYTEVHFHDEEEYMKSINYPGLEAQQYAHSFFVEKFTEIDFDELNRIDDNQNEYLEGLINFLLNWLSNHILGTDKKIGEYVGA